MPPRIRFTREDILNAAFEIARESGMDALNARSIAARLGSSTQPLFRVFAGMEDIRAGVLEKAAQAFDVCVRAEDDSDIPLYKRTGMAYIRFAREEPWLFKLMFMSDRAGKAGSPVDNSTMTYVMDAGADATGLTADQMEDFHLHMWIYVHGLASMIATGFLVLDDETVSRLITRNYLALKQSFFSREKQ